jgi:hypothetical protein
VSEHVPDHTAEDEVRHLPVLAAPEARPIERIDQMPISAPVAAATGGFLAGVGAIVLMRVLRGGGRRALPFRVRRRRTRGAIEIAGSRSFLVDVHVLKR